MAVLTWNESANKIFETGLDMGVLYVRDSAGDYPLGVAWEGLMSVSEKPGGAEPTDLWANNVKYATLISAETFEGSIGAYTYPEAWLACDGMIKHASGAVLSGQARAYFGLAYRTYVGSEAAGQTAEEKLHVIYGCTAKPSEVSRETMNDSPAALEMSWDFTTTPASATGYMAVSKITLDSRNLSENGLAAVKDALFGTVAADPYLPLPDDLLTLAATV